MFIINASLPRAGSTLLSNIMGNHPDIYASPTSSLVDLVAGGHAKWQTSLETLTEGYNPDNEFYTDTRKDSVKAFLNQGIKAYYDVITDKEHVIDKGRAWMMFPDLVQEILPDTTILCAVRHPFDIFASLEKIYRRTPMVNKLGEGTLDLDTGRGLTVETRVYHWYKTMFSFKMFPAIKGAIQQRKENIFWVPFEVLTDSPEEVMTEIYKYLGIVDYKHDFSNIQQVTHEADIQSIHGLHKIRPEVKPVEQDAVKILGVPTCLWIQQELGWFMEYFGYKGLENKEE